MTVIYASYVVYVYAYQVLSVWCVLYVVVWWDVLCCVDTFCSINKLHSGSQLASTYFSMRHVSNLLRKIFFNLAGLPFL